MAEWEEIAMERQDLKDQIKAKIQNYKKPVVKNLSDIKNIINAIKNAPPRNDESILSFDYGGEEIKATVKGKSKLQVLQEGVSEAISSDKMESRGIVINGRSLKPVNVARVSWVDKIIEEWMAGHRDGQYICWKLNEALYKYDILNHKLIKSQ